MFVHLILNFLIVRADLRLFSFNESTKWHNALGVLFTQRMNVAAAGCRLRARPACHLYSYEPGVEFRVYTAATYVRLNGPVFQDTAAAVQ